MQMLDSLHRMSRALQEKVFAEFEQKRQEHAQLKLLDSQSSDGPQLSPPVVPSFPCFVASLVRLEMQKKQAIRVQDHVRLVFSAPNS